MASVDGPDAVRADTVVRLWDHYGVAKAHFDELAPAVRSHLEAFVRGINAFYAAHPEDVPAWWGGRKVDPYMVIAFSRLFLYSWSIDQAFDDLERGGIEPGFDETERGSNQFAVAPSRSAEGAAILAIDPHLGWFGPSRFWEFRIHADGLRGSGFSLPGVPYIGLGHNENVAWAMTTGGPDTADIYELTLPTKYSYDGEWRSLSSEEVSIAVKNEEPRKMSIRRSHYGPIVAMRNGKAYAAKTSYADTVNINEAWYRLNFAADYKGAVAAMETRTLFPQNVMVADTSGNIYYQRTGRVPKRPEGLDTSRPLDGSTSATEWQGLHPASDHVQILNPPQGYMQNCNIPPDAMMVNSPLTWDSTLPYLFADASYGPRRPGVTNLRGAQAVALLAADDSVTAEEARTYINDIKPFGVERWIGVLRNAHEQLGSEYAQHSEYTKAIDDILNWNGELARDSSGAMKYVYWREQLEADHGADTMSAIAPSIDQFGTALGVPEQPVELSQDELKAALESFVNAMTKLTSEFGSLDAAYGDRFRVGRDERSWPLGGGGNGSHGLTTLRNIGYSAPRDDHTQWGRSGQTSTQIVVMTKPVRSWTYVPIGQSDRPESPHYNDQAEKLFSRREMKETWWLPETLAEHIESRTQLDNAR